MALFLARILRAGYNRLLTPNAGAALRLHRSLEIGANGIPSSRGSRTCGECRASQDASSLNRVVPSVLAILDLYLCSALSGPPCRRAIHDDWKVILRISRTSLDIGRFAGTSFVLQSGVSEARGWYGGGRYRGDGYDTM